MDEGEWFIYTGSGGRDLSGNKRTNKEQSFDQKFDKSNLALKVSCLKGLPVRVVRSHKARTHGVGEPTWAEALLLCPGEALQLRAPRTSGAV